MGISVQTIINQSSRLNREATVKCQNAEEVIRDITLAYKQPVDTNCSFVVSFVGRFKTGKSSLINALIGAEILPTKATTATSVVTRIFYGTTPKCWLSNEHEDKEISIDEGKDIILNYKVTNVNRPVEVIFELPIPWIKGNIELRDTPGMDDSSQDGKLETIALNALKDTDLCVCVYDASTMISEKERARTQRIHKMMSGNVVYAVNCTNRLNSIESVNQVETLSKNFFGAMKYSIPGMGKYYMMCSAPKMIELDGFDKWLHSFVSNNNLPLLNRVRTTTGVGQVNVFREEFAGEAQRYAEQIEQQAELLAEKHDEIIRERQKANSQTAQNEAADFTRKVANLETTFSEITSELREKILECKNKGTDYESNTKAKTQDYFINRYKSIIGNYGSYFSISDVQFIRSAFQSVTFPGTHTKTVKATSEDRKAGALTGGLIGGALAILTGGAAIPFLIGGAAAGGLLGNGDTTVDDSVDNTMSFVRNTVVPLMKKAMNEKISSISRTIKNKGVQKCNSGLEDVISETQNTLKMLNKYCPSK